MAIIIGEDADTALQVLRGTDSDDLILTALLPDDDDKGSAYSLDDVLRIVFAGTGDDMVKGRQNIDELHGGPGMDSIRAGRGDDLAWGGEHDDQIGIIASGVSIPPMSSVSFMATQHIETRS